MHTPIFPLIGGDNSNNNHLVFHSIASNALNSQRRRTEGK